MEAALQRAMDRLGLEDPDALVTARQGERVLGVSRNVVHEAVRRGRLRVARPGAKKGHIPMLFRLRDVVLYGETRWESVPQLRALGVPLKGVYQRGAPSGGSEFRGLDLRGHSPDDLVDGHEAARILGVKKCTVLSAAHQGRLDVAERGSDGGNKNPHRFRVRDLMAYRGVA